MAGSLSGSPTGLVTGPLSRSMAVIMMACVSTAFAVETRGIRDNTSTQFAQGETTGIEVLAEGRLRIAPTLQRLERTSESVTWAISTHPTTTTAFFATGHNGKVFRSTGQGDAELWADLPDAQALSLAQDPTGGIFIGTAPAGRIYRVREAGKPELFFETGERYVWSLLIEPTGAVLAGTGPNGKLFRIWGRDNGSVHFKADQTNIMGLTLDRHNKPLLALQGKAALVRVDDPERGYVLWSGPEDEARTVVQDPVTGSIFAAINSARASGMADLTASKDDSGPAAGGAPNSSANQPSQSGRPPSPGEFGSSSGSGSGPSSGAVLLRILPSGFASIHWSAPEAPIHALLALPDGGGVLVAAGRKGRVWRVNDQGIASIIADSEEGMVTTLAGQPGRILMGTANRAGLEVLTTTGTRTGQFQSRTLNAAGTVRWGNLHLDLDPLGGTSVTVEVRTGNTAEASSRSWTPFTTATLQASPASGVLVLHAGNPVAQYLQYRLTLSTDAQGNSPVVDGIQAFFLPQNSPPLLRQIEFIRTSDITVAASPGAASGSGAGRSPQSTAVVGRPGPAGSVSPIASPSPEALTMLMGRLGSAPRSQAGGSDSTPERPGGNNVVVTDNARRIIATWDATDPNGDRLLYQVRIKAEDEQQWRLLEEKISGNVLLLATDTLPDGRYRIEVTASDEESNIPESALTAKLVSRILTVDNSPPILTDLRGERQPNGSIRITGRAQDGMSTLAAGEFTVDASREPRLFLPMDGLFDSADEALSFTVQPTEKRPEHIVTVRVFDREGNSTVGRVIVPGQ